MIACVLACAGMLLMTINGIVSIIGISIPGWLWMLPSLLLTFAVILYTWKELTMQEFISAPQELIDLDSIIAHNEVIACRNATVVVNQDGEVTCWYDNAKPLLFMRSDTDEQD